MANLDLLVLSDNLFVLSHSQTFLSSSLTTDSRDFKLLFAYNIYMYHQQINRS